MPNKEPSTKEFLMALLRNPAIKDMSPKEVVELAQECHSEYVRSNIRSNAPNQCDMMTLPVSVLDPSIRLRRAMIQKGIRTLGELTQYTGERLCGSVTNFGKTSLNEVKVKLESMGLSLMDSDLPFRECRTCQGDCPVKAPVPQPHAPGAATT